MREKRIAPMQYFLSIAWVQFLMGGLLSFFINKMILSWKVRRFEARLFLEFFFFKKKKKKEKEKERDISLFEECIVLYLAG